MAIQQLTHLPGVQVELQDGGLRGSPAPLPPVTDAMIIIGTATDGPYMVPTAVRSENEAEATFGEYTESDGVTFNGATLVPAFRQALAAGGRNIYLMRINGKFAEATLQADLGSGPVDVATLRSRFPGSKYNSVHYEITGTELRIWADDDAVTGEPTEVFNLTKITTLSALVTAVNATSDVHGTVLELVDWKVHRDVPTADLMPTTGPVALAGGDDELDLPLGDDYDDAASLRGLLQRAYDTIAQSYPAAIIVPKIPGVVFDPVNDVDAKKLAEVCHQIALLSQFELAPIGVIAAKPLEQAPSAASIDSYVQSLTAGNPLKFLTEDNVDIGRYLSVVVGEPIFFDPKLKAYVDTGEVAYAGLVSSLAANRSPLNRPLGGAVRMRFAFNLKQADQLTGARYVVLNERSTTGPYVVDAPTAAQPNSDYRRLTTMRIAQLVTNRIRRVALPFLGEPMDVPTFTTLRSNLEQLLRDLRAAGYVQEISFNLNVDPNNPTHLLVSVSMVPVFEIKRVRISVALRLPQPA